VRPSIGLSELVAAHHRIVFDNSFLDATYAAPERRAEYKQELRKTLTPERFSTVKPVVQEASRFFWWRDDVPFLRRLRESVPNLAKEQHTYCAFLDAILPVAHARGIIKDKWKGDRTDAKVAALALTFAAHCPEVAFVSSDRALNDLVYDAVKNPVRDVYAVNIFYFWREETKFTAYDLADRRLTYGTVRRAVS